MNQQKQYPFKNTSLMGMGVSPRATPNCESSWNFFWISLRSHLQNFYKLDKTIWIDMRTFQIKLPLYLRLTRKITKILPIHLIIVAHTIYLRRTSLLWSSRPNVFFRRWGRLQGRGGGRVVFFSRGGLRDTFSAPIIFI